MAVQANATVRFGVYGTGHKDFRLKGRALNPKTELGAGYESIWRYSVTQ